ncbi:MAG: FkbM family methyltransferase [Candidatus Cloacimonetes bacterium]|jgi:FkbM family methyltransferase|nr:FkbM family methyltransferase [Candidatus Cloacimonadota bacterium]MDD4155485.1 FkbM family methyltransferase [Candidatus Cloacimonadota bacterium]
MLKKDSNFVIFHKIIKNGPIFINFRFFKKLCNFYLHYNKTDYYHTKYGWPLFDKNNFFANNKELIETLTNKLSDEKSKKIYKGMIKFRQSRDIKDYPFHIIKEHQYFLKQLKFTEDEVYIDCGASGVTIDLFIKKCPKYKEIIAFEPNEKHYNRLLKRFQNNQKIKILKAGVYDKDCEMLLSNKNKQVVSNDSNIDSQSIKLKAIDNLNLDKVSFIKMDVEGSELSALKGAEKTILRDKPKLAISIYHKCEDMVEIFQYLSSLVPDYHFYVRQYHFVGDTILYAIIDN